MALNLSRSELASALAGLSPSDRRELLQLLEQREALEPERPEDARVPIDTLIEQARQQAAAKSADPAAWLERDAEHWECHQRHYQRLVGDRRGDTENMNAWMEASLAAWHEATELADAESPHPDRPAKRAEPIEEVDPDDDPPPLPRATAADIAYSRAREAFAADPPSWIDGI